MEKCGIADHIHMRVICDKFSQSFHGVFMGLWLAHIKSDLFLKVLPSVCHRIVHMHRIPHDICQKAHRIIMKSLWTADDHISCLRIVAPLVCRYHFSCSPVDHLPPSGNIIMIVYLKHIRIQMIHEMDSQILICSSIKGRHDIHLLDLIRICLGPGIVFSCSVICRIYLGIHVLQFFRIIRAVTVPDRVCSPSFQQFQCLRHHVHICGDRHSSSPVFFHCSSPFSGCFLRSIAALIILKKKNCVNLHIAHIFIYLAYCAISSILLLHFSKNILYPSQK